MPEPAEPRRLKASHSQGGRVSHYRVERPHAGIIETELNRFEATEYAESRRGGRGRMLNFRDLLLGSALSNRRLSEERLSKTVALAIFSSDALSSTAYATQEIILVLLLAGSGALHLSFPIAIAITALLAIVVASYRQTVRAYPGGGGAYIVAHENLGMWPGLVAAASLLIDYVLTAAVSVAAGVEAIVSARQDLHPVAVPIALFMLALLTLGNLRGLRESGTIFAIPTYGFVLILGGTLIWGLMKITIGDHDNPFTTGPAVRPVVAESGLTLFLVLRAFSAGCTALTGVEAISNGVQAFRPPESKNAASTMMSMALLLGALFLGTTLLARHLGVVYQDGDKETVLSQIGSSIFGRNIFYYSLQTLTAGILLLAANTSFNGFPLLAAILGRDGYMPRVFYSRGNRLVFTYGILALSGLAGVLLIAFDASTTRLIPLYALGVFLSFTLAQSGMVRRWLRTREPGWRSSLAINASGAVATGVVFVIILVTKFSGGAWMVVIALPLMTVILWRIGAFYLNLKRHLNVSPQVPIGLRAMSASIVPAVVPIETIDLASILALAAACERSSRVLAVHVRVDPDEPGDIELRWGVQFPHIPLVVIDSPYRTVSEPIALFLKDLAKDPPHEVLVFTPRLETGRGPGRLLVNQSLSRLPGVFGQTKRIRFIDVPVDLGSLSSLRASGDFDIDSIRTHATTVGKPKR